MRPRWTEVVLLLALILVLLLGLLWYYSWAEKDCERSGGQWISSGHPGCLEPPKGTR